MNTEQTNRTLAEIAFEAFDSAQDLGDPGHWYQQPADVKQWWEASAQAIATEVLKRLPGEWILLHEEEIIEIGDEKYSVGMWAPVSVNVLGKMVGGRIVRRRLSAPSQQPQLGSPEGLRSAQGESPPAVADVPRAPMTHTLKTWAEFYGKVASGEKNFEVRFNDRDFRVGDTLVLEEYDPQWRTFTGQKVERVVTYVLHGWGLKDDHVAMGLSERSTAVAPPPAPRAEWTPKFKVGDRVRVEGFQTTFTVEYLPHDSKDAYRMVGGYNAKEDELTAAPWKLPEPPENKQWHRADWDEAELTGGWRPLLDGELPQRGDLAGEKESWSPRTGQFNIPVTSESSDGRFVFLKHKTLRPLPAPSTPSNVNAQASADYWREMYEAQTISLRKEVAAALAQASEAEKQVETLRRKTDGRGVLSVTEEDETYREQCWKMMYSSVFLELEKHKKQVAALSTENTTLLASVPVWVPVSERVPMEKDGQEMKGLSGLPFYGMVIWGAEDFACFGHYDKQPTWATCWMHVPKLPLPPLPVETEEGDGFEEWASSRHYNLDRDDVGRYVSKETEHAQAIWQAALRSKKAKPTT
jgi:hypothetical protein